MKQRLAQRIEYARDQPGLFPFRPGRNLLQVVEQIFDQKPVDVAHGHPALITACLYPCQNTFVKCRAVFDGPLLLWKTKHLALIERQPTIQI